MPTTKKRSEAEQIALLLKRQHDGDPWHGPSRAALLKHVTPAIAAWDPGAGAHSIWQQVLHMRNWTREVEARVLGADPRREGVPVGGDWPAVTDTSANAWAETLASLDAAHEQLARLTLSLTQEQLDSRVGVTVDSPQGTGIKMSAMIRSLAEHDIYHCGMISLLNRLARASLGLKQL